MAGAAGIKGIEGWRTAVAQAPEQTSGVQLDKLVVIEGLQAPQETLAHKERQETVQERRVTGRIEFKLGGEESAKFAPLAQAEAFGKTLGLALSDKTIGGAKLRAGFIQTPEVVEILLGPAAHLLLVGPHQAATGNSQLAAELVQNGADQAFPLRGREGGDDGMKLPSGIVRAKGFQAAIADPQQTDILKIRLHHAPSAPQIFIEAVFGKLGKYAHDLGGGRGIGIKFGILADIAHG
jgi:hypothetical protein